MTSFQKIYDRFFGKITDDQYLEWTKEDTEKDAHNILIDAIPGFEFPRFPLFDYDENKEEYAVDLTTEEINIFAVLMYNTWLQRQIASVDNIRMGYSGPDFKMTSQANHLEKLMKLKREAETQSKRIQRLYKRRRVDSQGKVVSNWDSIMETSALEGGKQ